MPSINYLNRQTYDQLAQEYEAKAVLRLDYNRGVVDRFVKHITTGRRALDAGCAVGLDVQLLLEQGFEVTGVELSSEMAAFAKLRNPTAQIAVGDFMTINLPTGSFDAIWAQSFVHLFPKRHSGAVFSRLFDLLVPGGVVHITTNPAAKSSEGWLAKSDYQSAPKRFRKQWTKSELTTDLETTGFEIAEFYEITDPFNKRWMVFAARRPAA